MSEGAADDAGKNAEENKEVNSGVPAETSSLVQSADTNQSVTSTASVHEASGVVLPVTAPAQLEPSPPEADVPSVDEIKSAPPTVPTDSTKPPRAASVFSGETVRSGAASWLAPWTWYGTGSSSALPSAVASSTSVDRGGSKLKRQMTESEKVKEEALARDRERETDADAASHTSPALAKEESTNTSLTSPASRSGWASLFSLTGKGKEAVDAVKRDENGMEVMDLDLDDEGTKPSSSDGRKVEKKSSNDPVKEKERKKEEEKLSSNKDLVKEKPKKEKEKEKERRSKSKSKPSGSGSSTPAPPPPNLVLPTWQDTFYTTPRSHLPSGVVPIKPLPGSTLGRTMKYVSGVLFSAEVDAERRREKERLYWDWGRSLPRAWEVVEYDEAVPDVLRGCKKVVVIGIHGWFPGAVIKSVLGEPTGTSAKFVNMTVQALEQFQSQHNVRLDKITKIPLEGEGTIDRRVEKLYTNLLANQQWMDDLHDADAIFVATHSQGSVVSTHLIDRLIRERHIRTSKNGTTQHLSDIGVTLVPLPPQRVCCLALCGIHLGPLRYLSTSTLVQPYIQYFESTAARELFEFQNTENDVSKAYVKALRNVVDNGTKMVYVASLNDQVVPIYSGLFTSVSHPLILRALYIDGDAYHSSDFLSNLLVLLLRVLNCGLSDSGLLAHLSEVTAGSLNGVGHSTAYEELATFSLAVNYLFLTNDGFEEHPELTLEPFNASAEMNDYEIPWALRDLIADERVAHFFSQEITDLRNAFREWNPKTSILRDIKRKLQPIQRLPSTLAPGSANSTSKL
ncbi:hypothetical protein K435DRAFT_684718 [Dendrothele bispora CBS 962.96]|uniref:YMC020W-like alpha/beta hydrolase domain-containing protein n=1 Tax=Dendrothele bispora (strain CBS 962.96) TaxID=1314807 RepID=A0A4S8LB55_DENBC|nr:hypothetical protein K435DRAFT_684718 [Dendrothele bispora CBS 962.96]